MVGGAKEPRWQKTEVRFEGDTDGGKFWGMTFSK